MDFNDALLQLVEKHCGENKVEDLKKILNLPAMKLRQIKFSHGSLSSQKKIEEGNLRFHFELMISFCKTHLKIPKYLKFLIDVIDLLINNGEVVVAENVSSTLIILALKQKKQKKFAAHGYLKRGEIYLKQAKWEACSNDFKKARKIFEEFNDNNGIGKCYNNFGLMYAELGDLGLARKYFNKSLDLFFQTKDEIWQGKLIMNLGILETIQNNWNEAISLYGRAIKIFSIFNDLKRLAEIHHNLGMLYKQKGEYQIAVEELDQSIKYSKSANLLSPLGITFLERGEACIHLNDDTNAILYCDRALEIFNKLMDRLSIADTYKVKAIILKKLSNYDLAETYLLISLRLNEELENRLNYGETAFELAALYRNWGKEDQAREFLLIAKESFEQVGSSENVKKICELLAA